MNESFGYGTRTYSSYRFCTDCNIQTKTEVTYGDTQTTLCCETCGNVVILPPLRIRKPARRLPEW